MLTKEEFVNNKLTVEKTADERSVHTIWRGKSNERNPEQFVTPLLERLAEECDGRTLILDFRELTFMNSSTITPVIRFLELYKESELPIEILYDKNIHWQELSFTALEIFESPDSLIKIIGDKS